MCLWRGSLEQNGHWYFAQYWCRLLLWGAVELLKRQTLLGGLPQKEPQTPSFTLQEESTWTQMPTTQKKISNKTRRAGPDWKVTVWVRAASRTPTIFRKLIIYKRKILKKQSFEILCVESKQGMMPYFPLSGTCFRRLTPEELSASCAS